MLRSRLSFLRSSKSIEIVSMNYAAVDILSGEHFVCTCRTLWKIHDARRTFAWKISKTSSKFSHQWWIATTRWRHDATLIYKFIIDVFWTQRINCFDLKSPFQGFFSNPPQSKCIGNAALAAQVDLNRSCVHILCLVICIEAEVLAFQQWIVYG